MMTVAQAMEHFVSSLEIDRCRPDADGEHCGSCTSCDARRQRDVLRKHLEAALAVKEFTISGSYKRRTAIRPLNDIDLFLVLDPETEAKLREAAPRDAIAKLVEILDEAYPTKEKPKAQSRSVNVDFKQTGLAFDVVPAFPHEGGGYVIPDRDAGTWIRTNPKVHAAHSTAANEAAGNKAKPIVKALKHWNASQEDKVVRSFHLELMVYEALAEAPSDYASGIAQAFRGLADRVLSPMSEPAGVGPDVDEGMKHDERVHASAAFRHAADLADKANAAKAKGRTGEAHYQWRALFGSAYPEKGTTPTIGAPAIIAAGKGSSPDPKTNRFG